MSGTSRRIWCAGLLLAACLSIAPTARAQTGGLGPCTMDARALCPDAKRGTARHRCLLEHDAELSTSCRDHLKQRQAQRATRRAAVWSACQEEIDRWCAIATVGEGGVMGCLRRKTDELSPACRDALPARGDTAP